MDRWDKGSQGRRNICKHLLGILLLVRVTGGETFVNVIVRESLGFGTMYFTDGGIMVNMVLCVIPGQGNSKILNLVNSGSFDSPIFLYIPNDEKTSMGHLI